MTELKASVFFSGSFISREVLERETSCRRTFGPGVEVWFWKDWGATDGQHNEAQTGDETKPVEPKAGFRYNPRQGIAVNPGESGSRTLQRVG
jgi:hypothetical protein